MLSAFDTLSNPECIDAICFDMDGVLADLFGQEDWLEKLNTNQAAPYFNAAPLVDTEYLNEIITLFNDWFGVPTYIISWGSKECDWYFDKQTEKTKRYWLDKFLPAIPAENIFVVPYGIDKSTLVQNACTYPVLFDDTVPNCDNWWWDNSVPIVSEHSNDVIISTLSDLFNCLRDACGRYDAPAL